MERFSGFEELNLVTGRSVIYCDHGPASATDETDILICDFCELPIAPGDENPRTFKGDPYCFCSECIIQAEDWFQEEFGDD